MREKNTILESNTLTGTPRLFAVEGLDKGFQTPKKNGVMNKLNVQDTPAHNWYRFVLSYPPHLVRDYLIKFGAKTGDVVLDPFCGTGTTLVEAKKQGLSSIGIEANPMAYLASKVKTDWGIDPNKLMSNSEDIAKITRKKISVSRKLKVLTEDKTKMILKNSISPIPLHKTLSLFEAIRNSHNKKLVDHQLLALAKVIVYSASNLHFGPEVGVKGYKKDADVVSDWLDEIRVMTEDLKGLNNSSYPKSEVHQSDARNMINLLPPQSVDFIITSPPYPNEKDYSRTTRLESVILELIKNKEDLRSVKKTFVRSNTRSVYKEDTDDQFIKGNKEIQRIANEIESRRIAMNKNSGFEKMYARVTKLYFGGMAKHLADLRTILKPGAKLAYVVGDQASYLQVMIRTGQILAEIAESLGYKVIDIELFRTRLATATKQQLREEVLLLQWNG